MTTQQKTEESLMREFNTGATRNTDSNKLDYEGFISPAVLQVFAEYMHKHRKQADGKLRASDNWQKGIPKEAYAKSLIRHTFQFWSIHRGSLSYDEQGNDTLREALCGILFNAMGYLFEDTKGR